MKKHYGIVYLILVALFLFPSILMSSADFKPIFNPEISVTKTDAEIKVDGDLSDYGWSSASRISQFHERSPRELAEPPVKTEAMITYDEDNLYIAFVCYDDPASVRATMCQRDQFGGDDNVCVLIDTYGDASRAYEFLVNPYGIQKDLLWASVAGEDQGFDLIWESSAKITEQGYQVEMAIPFNSLRFPNSEVQSWRIDFWRNRPRESYNQYSWAAYDRNEQCWVCQWGTLNGLRDVRPGKGLEILPAMVANQSGRLEDHDNPDSKFNNGDVRGEFSLGGKYSPTSDITIEAAYNPDFSQIEADAAQIDVNTTMALFYPERRPFFQEGSDLFRTLFNSFYTRTINDPQFAAKLIGRLGGTSIAGLSSIDENTPYIIPLREGSILLNTGKSYVNVFRGLQTVGNNSRVGVLASDRRFDYNGSGSVLAFDFDLGLSRNYRIDGQYIGTHVKEAVDPSFDDYLDGIKFNKDRYTAALDGESYYGTAFITRFSRGARHLNFMIDYDQISPTYRTEIGYDPINSHRTVSSYANYNIYPEGGIFNRISPGVFAFRRWEWTGPQRQSFIDVGIEGQLKLAQTFWVISYNTGNETYNGIRYDGLRNVEFNLSSRFSQRLGYSLGIYRGIGIAYYAQTKGNETGFYLGLNLKPVDRIIIEPNVEYTKSDDHESGERIYEGYIFRSRVGYQASRQMSIRLVVQYNNFNERWDIDPLLTYRLNSFTVFYVGSTYDYNNYTYHPNDRSEWRLSSRQFFMKLQYLFRT
jgi:hypothetical protein